LKVGVKRSHQEAFPASKEELAEKRSMDGLTPANGLQVEETGSSDKENKTNL
jgi:hypothetical protein